MSLTERGPRANNPARLPALPASTAADPARRQWEEMVREWLEVRLGARGDFYERAVTHRELKEQLDRLQAATGGEDLNRLLSQVALLRGQVNGLLSQLAVVQTLLNSNVTNTNNTSSQVTNLFTNLRDVAVEDVAVFAPQMRPSVTDGCGAEVTFEFAATQPNLVALPFLANVDTSADFTCMLPFSWAGRNFKIWVYWAHAGSGTAWDVAWEVTSNGAYDDEPLILDFLPGVLVTDTGGTPGNLYIAQSTAVPIASYENEAGSLVALRATRRGTFTEDTMDITAYLLAVRFTLEDIPLAPPPGDPYWASVTLLVQGGTDGGTTVQDLSTYGDSVTITSGAAFDNDHQVFSANPIRATVLGADIGSFSSTGLDGRFTRPSGEDCTIEVYAYYTSLDNTTANWLFLWDTGIGGRLCELGFGNSSGSLRFRAGDSTEVNTSNLAANTLHYIQLTFVGNTYYLDAGAVPGDGTTTQLATGTAPASNTAGTTNFRVCRHFNTSATASTGGLWATPIRVTKGVARPRGSVPTAAFPTY